MTARTLLRITSRIGVVSVVLVVLSLIAVQYARMIDRNVVMARQLHSVEGDLAMLRVKRAEQLREITRLSDPRGAVPEIHDRLHLVGDKEAIIYLKGAQQP